MIKYRILPEQKLIVICNWGVTTIEEILNLSQDMRNDPHFQQNYDAIVDNTHFEGMFTSDEVRKLSIPRIDKSRPVGKLAVIAPADITYGISRMHEIMAESKSSHQINIFRDTSSALRWLDREGFEIKSICEEIKAEKK